MQRSQQVGLAFSAFSEFEPQRNVPHRYAELIRARSSAEAVARTRQQASDIEQDVWYAGGTWSATGIRSNRRRRGFWLDRWLFSLQS
jgi:hypothetical protein